MGTLRLLLALLVVIAHVQTGGWSLGVGPVLAVKAFFILSGFYMALTLSDRLRYPSARRFWSSRLWRLLPVHLVALAALVVLELTSPSWTHSGYANGFGWWWLVNQPPEAWWLAVPFTLSNLLFLGADWISLICVGDGGALAWAMPIPSGYCRGIGHPGYFWVVNQPMWTLGVEAAFYLLAPFLTGRRWPALLAVTVLAALPRLWLIANGLDAAPYNRATIATELIYFLLGIWGYRLYRLLERRDRGQAGILGGVALATPLLAGQQQELALVLAVAFGAPGLFLVTRSITWDRTLGDLAYPSYVVQYLILSILHVQVWPLAQAWPWYLWIGLNVGSILAAAWLLDRLVQRPLEAWRRRWLGHHENSTDFQAAAVGS